MPFLGGYRAGGGRAVLVGLAYVGAGAYAWDQKSFIPLIVCFIIGWLLKPALNPDERDLRLKTLLASPTGSQEPSSTNSEPKKKNSNALAVFFVVAMVGAGFIIRENSPSAPEPPQQTPVVLPAKPTPLPSNPAPIPQMSLQPGSPVQPSAYPTAQTYNTPSPTNPPASSPEPPASPPEQEYANLVAKMEIQGQYDCLSCTDPVVRCNREIPKKTLETQAEKDAWLQLLKEANGDVAKALGPLIKSQCRGY